MDKNGNGTIWILVIFLFLIIIIGAGCGIGFGCRYRRGERFKQTLSYNGSKFVSTSNSSKKFFNECPQSTHLDHRFCNVNIEDPKETLILLLREFMKVCNSRGIRPILQAGGLIGWNFNRKLLPWDDDIDMFVQEVDIPKLIKLDKYKTDTFFIEINPNHTNRSQSEDPLNTIDARVISSSNGLFIDIVFLLPDENDTRYIRSKVKKDHFLADMMLPPISETFEGIQIFVPARPKDYLVARYGKRAVQPYGHGPPGNDSWNFVNGEWKLRR